MNHFANLIAACERRVRPAPHEYPAHDYPWGIREVKSVDELIEQFRHGNWSVRTGFVLGDLAFVEQVSGGNEWLALKLTPASGNPSTPSRFTPCWSKAAQTTARHILSACRKRPGMI